MILNGTAEASVFRAGVEATVSLDISISDLLAQLKQLFPRQAWIGIVRNPASTGVCQIAHSISIAA
jgi:hypothetical protein